MRSGGVLRSCYSAKQAIGELHCGLRNFNIGVCAFLRDAREAGAYTRLLFSST